MVETGKHNLKFAETGKVFVEAVESRKSLKRQWKVAETETSEKKPRKAGKGRSFLRKTGKRPPITPLSLDDLSKGHVIMGHGNLPNIGNGPRYN